MPAGRHAGFFGKRKMETVFYIKNMVCDRCVMAVEKTLRDLHLDPVTVELGVAKVNGEVGDGTRADLRQRLEALGFELLENRQQQTIDRIRRAVIRLVRRQAGQQAQNMSDYLARELGSDYSALSKLFSEVTGTTIERYYINQRIERVKELLTYDELSLTQIALQMNYSSVAYLSGQFKQVTGMTPSRFKSLHKNLRQPLDKIG